MFVDGFIQAFSLFDRDGYIEPPVYEEGGEDGMVDLQRPARDSDAVLDVLDLVDSAWNEVFAAAGRADVPSVDDDADIGHGAVESGPSSSLDDSRQEEQQEDDDEQCG